MKKLLIGLLSLLLAVFLCACSTEESTEETTDAATTAQLDSYIGGELSDLMAAVDELGYTATYFNQGEDWTELLTMDETWPSDFLVGSLNEDPNAKTVKVHLKLKVNAEQEEIEAALKEKLEVGYAWSAAEKYGQDIYGSDFKINYLVGQIDSYAEDADTWSLKAECELHGEEKTCEALVTGTTENPEVLSLDVY